MASSPSKRRRDTADEYLEGRTGADDDHLPTQSPREKALAESPEWAAPAASAVLLCVGQHHCNVIGDTTALARCCWRPLFTHQQFPGETVWGYRAPRVTIHYSDPDLRMAVRATAESMVGRTGSKQPRESGGELPPPDSLAECLRLCVPDGYPGASLAVHAGPQVRAAPQGPPALFHPDASTTWSPPGPAVARFTVPAGGDRDDTFVIHRWGVASSPASQAYHDRMSTLSMWLIESDSPVDTTDAAWTVYALYKEAEEEGGDAAASGSGTSHGAGAMPVPCARLRFAGYATTYAFVAPFRKPRPASVRLAQLLLLPPYQRRGLGLRLMDAILSDCGSSSGEGVRSSVPLATVPAAGPLPCPSPFGGRVLRWDGPWLSGDAHEVTVESPCDGMARLRDTHDLSRALGHCHAVLASVPGWESYPWAAAVGAPSPALSVRDLSSKDLESVRSLLRCTSGQAHRLHEALLVAAAVAASDVPHAAREGRRFVAEPDLPLHAPGSSGNGCVVVISAGVGGLREEGLRPVRLLIKRRLLATHADLAAVRDVDARKALLEDAYQEAFAQYAAACGAVRPVPLVPRGWAGAVTRAYAAREACREKELQAQGEA